MIGMRLQQNKPRPLRAVIIGARRARQGLGPFVARDLVRHGCHVVGISTTNTASLEIAQQDLEKLAGVAAAGFTNSAKMIEETAPDLVVVLSPPEFHEAHLLQALDAGCHVICEKPMVWGELIAQRAKDLAQNFAQSGLVMVENCQWPEVLAAYDTLHPNLRGHARGMEMCMTPDTVGLDGLRDCLPHVLSVAQESLALGSRILGTPQFQSGNDNGTEVHFDFGTLARKLKIIGRFFLSDVRPRTASIGFDGHIAERHVDPKTYKMIFRDGVRQVPLEDPMTRHLEQAINHIRRALAGEQPGVDQKILDRAHALETLVTAFHDTPASAVEAAHN